MSNLTTRLREHAASYGSSIVGKLEHEAADRIEALEADLRATQLIAQEQAGKRAVRRAPDQETLARA